MAGASVTPFAADGRPRGTSYRPIAWDAKSAAEQDGNHNADVELGSSASPADRARRRYAQRITSRLRRRSSCIAANGRPSRYRDARCGGWRVTAGGRTRTWNWAVPPLLRSTPSPSSPTTLPVHLATPLPAHQVAGQIVAAAHAIQREEAQPIGTLAAKPARVIGRQGPSPRASAGGSRDHHHPHVAQAGRAGYSRRSQPI